VKNDFFNSLSKIRLWDIVRNLETLTLSLSLKKGEGGLIGHFPFCAVVVPVCVRRTGRGDYIIKELLDAPPFCGTYSKSKELLFLPLRLRSGQTFPSPPPLSSPFEGEEVVCVGSPWKEEGVLIDHFPFLGDIMFDKSNRYIYFLLDFVAVGFIRLFQIFQYRNYFLDLPR